MNVNNTLQNNQYSELVDKFLSLLPDGLGTLDISLGIRGVFLQLLSSLSGEGWIGYLCLVLFLATAESVIEICLDGRGCDASPFILCALLLALCSPVIPLLFTMLDALDRLFELFSLALPLFVGCASGMGAIGTASVQSAGFGTLLSLLGFVSSDILPALGVLSLFFAVASPILRAAGFGTDGAISFLFRRICAIFTAVVSGALALQSVLACASDSLTLRAARLAVGGTVPIVGGVVSGALSSLVGGFSYAASLMGVLSVVSLCSIALSPLLLALLYRLSLFLGLCVLKLSGARQGCEAFGSLISALDAVISAYALILLIYGLECCAFSLSLPRA